MFNVFVLIFYFVTGVCCLPTNYLKRIAENHNFDDFENFIPKYDDFPSIQFSSNGMDDDEVLLFRHHLQNNTKENNTNVRTQHEQEDFNSVTTTLSSHPETETFATDLYENIETTTEKSGNYTTFSSKIENDDKYQLEPTFQIASSESNESSRTTRQETNDTKSDPEFESQEEGSSEEQGNMITGLISTFLGGFSRPDGGIDIDAIVGLLGSLSMQNEDGTYDFQGLIDLLRGFLGGDGEGGGGSDIGAFTGGLLAAIIKGVANPPGAKGAGILTGKIVTGVLPALSGPAPAMDEDDNKQPPPQTLDSGGFLAGLLKTILGSSGGGGMNGGGGGSSFNIIKTILSSITSIFTSSSNPS